MENNGGGSQPARSTHSYSKQGWITNFNLNTANSDQIGEYIEERIRSYEKRDEWEEDQWLSFKEDFAAFTLEHLVGPTEAVKTLRDCLRNRGVWIPKDGKPIASNVMKSLDN